MARNMHKFEELTPWEFDQEKEHASIIYIAAGPMEYHEECNALGIDPCKGYAWCLYAAEKAGGIVFPLVPFAPDGGRPFQDQATLRERWNTCKFGEYTRTPLIYPSVYSSREVCVPLYRELLETFAVEHKFKLCVFFGSHAPAGDIIKMILEEEAAANGIKPDIKPKGAVTGDYKGMRVLATGSLDFNRDIVRKIYDENGIKRISHGGLWESAINKAVNEEYFQEKYLDETIYPQHYGVLKDEEAEGIVRPVKSEYKKMTDEIAKTLFETTAERFTQAVIDEYSKVK